MSLEVNAEQFHYLEGQSSARVLASTGQGNCLAYAKLSLINNVLFELYVHRDAREGLHFGALDTTAKDSPNPVLHHMRNNTPTHEELNWSEPLTHHYYSSNTPVIQLHRPRPHTTERQYTLADENNPSALIIINEPFLFLEFLGMEYEDTNRWKAVLRAAERHQKELSPV